MVTFGLLLSFASIAAIGLKTLDSVLIGKFLPLSFVGIYTIASFIPTIIETPLNALDRIVTAKVAHAVVENDMDDVKDVLQIGEISFAHWRIVVCGYQLQHHFSFSAGGQGV